MLKRILLSFVLLAALAGQSGYAGAFETVRVTALSAVTTGTSAVYPTNNAHAVGMAVAWASGVTAGVVALEFAPTATYAGTWATESSQSAATVTPPAITEEAVEVAAQYCRARVTTTVSGGGSPSATVYLFFKQQTR